MSEAAELTAGDRTTGQPIRSTRVHVLAVLARGGLPLLLLTLLAAGLLISLGAGAASLSLSEVLGVVMERSDSPASRIVWDIRMPRALLAALVGMNLAISGTLLQGIMRNPLAAPDIIGVTAGAGLGATAMLVLTQGLPTLLPIVAFVGAMVAALVVYTISWQPGVGTSPVRMVLAGIAVNVMLGAFTSFLMVAFGDRVQQVVFWMSGNLVDSSWTKVRLILPYSLVGLVAALLLIRPLNLLQLGEEVATGLGIHVERTRLIAMAAAALLAASAVSVAGLVGFVGLVIPHLMRMLTGHQHGRLLPAACAAGAGLLVWADLAARNVLAPAELPVGILTALLGGPYFIFLLYRKKLL